MFAGRRDTHHADVRDRWRDLVGRESVRDTADLGGSFGDIVLGICGLTIILEVKSSKKVHHQRAGGVRPGQARAMAGWRGGPWLVVESFEDSLSQVGAYLRSHGFPAPRAA